MKGHALFAVGIIFLQKSTRLKQGNFGIAYSAVILIFRTLYGIRRPTLPINPNVCAEWFNMSVGDCI